MSHKPQNPTENQVNDSGELDDEKLSNVTGGTSKPKEIVVVGSDTSPAAGRGGTIDVHFHIITNSSGGG